MKPITKQEIIDTISAHPMICTRAIIKALRPEEFKDQNLYLEYIAQIRPLLEELYDDGTIVSAKVQYCTFNLKQWQIN